SPRPAAARLRAVRRIPGAPSEAGDGSGMSNDSSNPPKGGKGSEPPGLVSRSPRGGIFDAIPTEAEGDALFDELFGDFDDDGDTSLEVDDFATSEGDRPTAEVPVARAGEGSSEAPGVEAD